MTELKTIDQTITEYKFQHKVVFFEPFHDDIPTWRDAAKHHIKQNNLIRGIYCIEQGISQYFQGKTPLDSPISIKPFKGCLAARNPDLTWYIINYVG